MRTSQSYQFDEFPPDDQLWWIRWFDYITPRHGSTGTAGVTVYFSSISDQKLGEIQKARNPDFEFRKYQKDAAIDKIYIQASNIPSLVIGTVFRNATPQFSFDFSRTTINCDTANVPQRLTKSNEPFHQRPTKWDTEKYGPYYTLNRSEYALGNWNDSWLCVLRSGTTDFLIPCPEILRYFYCWHSKMVRIFTTGPWKNNLHMAINPDRTGIDTDDENLWHLTARIGFSLHHCKLLVPLFLDGTGYERANEIFTFFQQKSANGFPSIKANIPFRDGPTQLNVKGTWLQKGELSKFLVFQILGHTWPYPGITLNHNIDPDNRQGKVRIPIDARPPFDGADQPGAISDDKIADIISSEDDPNENLSKINFTIPAPVVYNITEIREKKEISHIYTKPPPYFEAITNEGDRTSTGEPSSGGLEHPANFVPIETSDIDRFDELVGVLDTLKSAGLITEYAVVSPPDDNSLTYNDFTLWKMPKVRGIVPGKLAYPAWALIKNGTNKRPRGALVVEIKVVLQNIYIMEIETRSAEGYRALMFKPVNPPAYNAINDALTHAVLTSGKFAKHPEIPSAIAVARGWKHSYKYEKIENQSNITIKKRLSLSPESLFGAIMEVVKG